MLLRTDVYLVCAADDSKAELARELAEAVPGGAREMLPGLFGFEWPAQPPQRLPYLAFARQVLPVVQPLKGASIRALAGGVADAIAGILPDHQPWSLHVFPFKPVLATTRMGARAWHTHALARGHQPGRVREREAPQASVGPQRCRLIAEGLAELLQKRRRHLLRYLRPAPGAFGPHEALVQLMLTSPDTGFLSVAPAPEPFEQQHVVSCFPGGLVAPATDKQAPSRAFAKLVEAELRMHRRILAGETCVDLGAAPGSWTYVAARRGAKVTAVDRSELRPDLMRNRDVQFRPGDAFRFQPEAQVDWLVCDVIAAAERSAELLLSWLRRGWCRNFVVTLKLDDAGSPDAIAQLKRELPALTSDFWLMRLCANKKEICAFGTRAPAEAASAP